MILYFIAVKVKTHKGYMAENFDFYKQYLGQSEKLNENVCNFI